jgi:hypothetical protein
MACTAAATAVRIVVTTAATAVRTAAIAAVTVATDPPSGVMRRSGFC